MRLVRFGREALEGETSESVLGLVGAGDGFGSSASLKALAFGDSDVLDATVLDSRVDGVGVAAVFEEGAEEEAGCGDAADVIFDFGLAASLTMLRALIQSSI